MKRKLYHYKRLYLILLPVFILCGCRILDTDFIIVNHTAYPIAYHNFQYTEREGEFDFTPDEYYSFKHYYVVEQRETAILSRDYWKSALSVVVGIDVRYQSKYITPDNIDTLKGANFKDYPTSANQKAYCGYQIEVYPNRKTVVTPTDKPFCIKPLYIYQPNGIGGN